MAPKISDEAKTLRRNIIIDHAMKLFSKKGFTETSMDDIVEASGISKGGIYNYFKSKEEIFLAIAEDRFAQRHKLVQSFTSSMSNKEKLIKYIEWILYGQLDEEARLNARFTFEFWSVLSKNKDTSDKSKERYELFRRDLSDILQSGVENGEFKKDLDIASMVYIILSSTDGMGFFNSVMNVPINESIIKNYIDIILKSL